MWIKANGTLVLELERTNGSLWHVDMEHSTQDKSVLLKEWDNDNWDFSNWNFANEGWPSLLCHIAAVEGDVYWAAKTCGEGQEPTGKW